jgi:MoxR-like ATPase
LLSRRFCATAGGTPATVRRMPETTDVQKAEIARAAQHLGALRAEMGKVIVGQRYLIDRLVICLITRGHALIEGLPGLAKTSAVNALARSSRCTFQRVQFTPDLLPADITGTLIYDPAKGTYSTRTGPIFANLVLADEINRAPSKVQSALLEAMQERQVTIGDQTYALPEPFLVLATQNPIEQEGTYPLPEAQMDRFSMKIVVGYPTEAEERVILDRMAFTKPTFVLEPQVSPAEIVGIQALVDRVYVDDQVKDYVVRLVMATRNPESISAELRQFIRIGGSPRATIHLTLAARACALLEGRAYATPDDVKFIAPDVLRHRILLSYEAEAEAVTTDRLIQTFLERVAVP